MSELKTCRKGARGRSDAQVSFLGYATSMTERGPAKVKGYSAQRLPTRTSESWTNLGSNITTSRTRKCATSCGMWVARRKSTPHRGTLHYAYCRSPATKSAWLKPSKANRGRPEYSKCQCIRGGCRRWIEHTFRVNGHGYRCG